MAINKIFFIIIFLLFSNTAKADCYDDIEFSWSFVNSNNEIEYEFLNNNNRTIVISEYGMKTSDKQIIRNNVYPGDEFLTSLTYVVLGKFGRSVKKLQTHDLNTKFIKYGYFICSYKK